jgi:DNA-binding transcriptional LysR family regulator
LKALEDEFRTRIVIRTPSGVMLTPQGEVLLAYAEEMLLGLTKTRARLLSIGDRVYGPLRIGSSAVFANYEMPQLLRGFLERYPEVEIFLKTGLSGRVNRMLEDEEVSVAIVRGDYPWSGERHVLREEPVCLVSASTVEIEELPDRPHVVYRTDASLQEMMDRWWRETFSRPSLDSMVVDTMNTYRQMVLHDLGWAILPSIGLNGLENLTVRDLHWKNGEPLQRRTWLYCHRYSLELPAVRAFIGWMTEHCRP